MGRKISREYTMKILYQMEIQNENSDKLINTFINENGIFGEDEDFIRGLIYGVLEKKQFIDNLIESNLRGWKIDRISKVDLAILRISVYEIMAREDIPINVSINEAIELAKKYSNTDSAAFINGILGKIYNTINKDKIED